MCRQWVSVQEQPTIGLALTPSNAVVEQAFSCLTRLLSPQRLSIDPSLVTLLLIVALDSVPWGEYDVSKVSEFMKAQKTRMPFRYPRSDKGGKHRKRQRKDKGAVVVPQETGMPAADPSESDSSDSNESGFSSEDVL